MRSTLCAVFLTVTLAWSGAAFAYDKTGAADIDPLGLMSCGKYIQLQQNVQNKKASVDELIQNEQFMIWVDGFTSGINMTKRGKDNLFDRDKASIRLYIENYCRANPLNNTVQALMKLFKDLNPGYKFRD